MVEIDQLTEKIIGCAMKVHRSLGYGFLESVYHRSLEIELASAGISFESEKRLNVFYEGHVVGHFSADLFLSNQLIIELKAIESIVKAHEVKLVNYLAATKIETGLLLNFGAKSLEVRRKFRHRKVQSNPSPLVNLE